MSLAFNSGMTLYDSRQRKSRRSAGSGWPTRSDVLALPLGEVDYDRIAGRPERHATVAWRHGRPRGEAHLRDRPATSRKPGDRSRVWRPPGRDHERRRDTVQAEPAGGHSRFRYFAATGPAWFTRGRSHPGIGLHAFRFWAGCTPLRARSRRRLVAWLRAGGRSPYARQHPGLIAPRAPASSSCRPWFRCQHSDPARPGPERSRTSRREPARNPSPR